MSDVIAYDEGLINDIISEYSSCKLEMERVIRLLEYVENNLRSNYVGKGARAIDSLFETLNAHLESYCVCLTTSESFVSYALESAILTEKTLLSPSASLIKDKGIGGA